MNSVSKSILLAKFALPYNHHSPSLSSQLSLDTSISAFIRFELRLPKIQFRLRPSRAFKCAVPVPKTSVHEDYFACSREDDIRRARQVFRVQSISIPHAMNESANDHLRLGVPAPYGRHVAASLLGGVDIHQSACNAAASSVGCVPWVV